MLVLEEIAAYYVYQISGSDSWVQDINAAVLLNGEKSISNSWNYVYYIASKLNIRVFSNINPITVDLESFFLKFPFLLVMWLQLGLAL